MTTMSNIITTDIHTALLATRFDPVASTRGAYGEICAISGPLTVEAILQHVQAALPPEASNWDDKGRGSSLSHDLYGWCPEERVAVVQVRKSERLYRHGYLNTRKDYVLAGYNEDQTPFRHPVSSAAVRGAVRTGASPADVVRAAQRWMWSVTATQLDGAVRQGDLLIVAERVGPRGQLIDRGNEARLAETHLVRAERLVTDPAGKLWAQKPVLSHSKGQHRDKRAPASDGVWFSIRVAETAPAWSWSRRLGG